MKDRAPPLDPEALSKWRRYFHDNFFEDFENGTGTEAVMSALHAHAGAGVWADLGSGTSTLFWSMCVPPMTEIHAVDISAEALHVLETFSASTTEPVGYLQAGSIFGHGSEHLRHQKRTLGHFHSCDALRPFSCELGLKRFDLVTAIGLLSLSGSPDRFREAFREVSRTLRPGGTIICASWILSDSHARQRGIRNDFLAADLQAIAVHEAGLNLLDMCTAIPVDQRRYSRVEVFSARA